MRCDPGIWLTALSAVLAGGCGSTPVAAPSPTRPLTAVTQSPSTNDPQDAAPAVPLLFHVEMFLVSFPTGAYSANEDFWKRIDEQCVDPATSDLLYKNGMRVGVARNAELEHFNKFMVDVAPHQRFAMAGAEMKSVELAMKTNLPFQHLFYFDREHDLVGQTFNASDNFINISFEPALRKPGTLRLTICPMVRASQQRLELTARNNEVEWQFVNDFKVYDLNCKVDIPQDCFLILSPSTDSWRSTSIGNAFFVQHGVAEKREQVLLVVPKAFKVEAAKK